MTRDEEIEKIFDVIYQAKIDLQDCSTQNLASRLYHAGLRFERVIEWPEKKPKEDKE